MRDISHAETENQAEDVAKILASLGVDEKIPQLEVWNKIDQMEADEIEVSQARSERSDDIFAISAITGEGIDGLLDEIAKRLQGDLTIETLSLPFSAGKSRAWLFAEGVIEAEEQTENGFELTVKWSAKQAAQFKKL